MSSKHVSITRSSKFISHASSAATKLSKNCFVHNRDWILDSSFSRSLTVSRRFQLDYHTSVHLAGKALFLERRKKKWLLQHRYVSEAADNIPEDTPPMSPKWGQPRFLESSKVIPRTEQDAKLDISVDRGSKSSLSTSESSSGPLKRGWGSPKFSGAGEKQDDALNTPKESGWKRPVFSTTTVPRASSKPKVRVVDAPVKRGWGYIRIQAPEDEGDMLELDAYQGIPTESLEESFQEHKAEDEASDELPTVISENSNVFAKEMSGTQGVEELKPLRQNIDTMYLEDSSQHPQTKVNDSRGPSTVVIQNTYVHYTRKKSEAHSKEDLSSRHIARLIKEDLLEQLMCWRRSTADMNKQLKRAIRSISLHNPTLGKTLQGYYATLSYSQTTAYYIARQIIRTHSLRKLSHLEPWLVTSIRLRKVYLSGRFSDVLDSRMSLAGFCRDSQFDTDFLKKFALDFESSEVFRGHLVVAQGVANAVYSRKHFLYAEQQMFKFRKIFFRFFSFLKKTGQSIQVWISDSRWKGHDAAYSRKFLYITKRYYRLMGHQWTEIYVCFLKLEEYRAQLLLSEMPEADYRKLRRRIEAIQRL